MATGVCRGCGGPGLVDGDGFCSPGCAYGGPSYVLDATHPPCWSCGGMVEPTGLCTTCDVECPAPDPDQEYAYDQQRMDALNADRAVFGDLP